MRVFVFLCCLLFTLCSSAFALTFEGLEPGSSKKEDADRILGEPIREVIEGARYDYDPSPYDAYRISIKFSQDTLTVETIDLHFKKSVDKAQYEKWFNLSQPAKTSTDADGNLMELYLPQRIALHYEGPDDSFPVKFFSHVDPSLFEEKTLVEEKEPESDIGEEIKEALGFDPFEIDISDVVGEEVLLSAGAEPDAIVGEWAWFNGGVVTINGEGTMTHDISGDSGTWEYTYTERGTGRFTLTWDRGGWVDTLTLSADGQKLEGTNNLGVSVSGRALSREIKEETLFEDNFDSENQGRGTLNYSDFVNWDVTEGSVDLIGRGFWDFFPDHGLYLDLDGSTGEAGKLESSTAFRLESGEYRLQFDLAGSPMSGPNTVTVTLGNLYSEDFTLAVKEPFRTIARTIRVPTSSSTRLIFEHEGGDNEGLLLDNVKLTKLSAETPKEEVGVLDLFKASEEWAREWTVLSTIRDFPGAGKAGFYEETTRSGHANPNPGREGVLYLHPVSREEPARLSRRITLTGSSPTLRMGVSGNREIDGDWVLVVKVDGDPLEEERIIAGAEGWQDLEFDLSAFSGQTVSVDVEAWANGWHYEYAFFDYIQIQEEEGEAPAVGPGVPPVLSERSEEEPNNRFSEAMSVTLDAKIMGAILPRGDRDRYRFQVSHQGQVDISITDSPPEMSLWFEVYNADYRRIAGPSYAAREGAENIGSADLPEPGEYWLQLGDQHDRGESASPYLLRLQFTATVDNFEPNGSLGRAREIPADGTLQAAILPRGDRDWYRVEVDDQGRLEINIKEPPKELALWIEVYDADARRIAGPFLPARQGVENFALVDFAQPGPYYIQLGDQYDRERSVTPYTLETTFTPTEDNFEPNPSFGKARLIPADGTLQAAILPRGDRDWYRVEVNKPGKLTLTLSPVPQDLALWIEVYDADARRIAGPFYAVREGAENISEVSLPTPGRYHIQIGTRHDAVSSADSYTLTTEFSPVP